MHSRTTRLHYSFAAAGDFIFRRTGSMSKAEIRGKQRHAFVTESDEKRLDF